MSVREELPDVYGTERSDRRRGLQMRCPTQVASRLRSGGWYSHAGYWFKSDAAEHGMRWWSALAIQMGEFRPAQQQEQGSRCGLTTEMFPEAAND